MDVCGRGSGQQSRQVTWTRIVLEIVSTVITASAVPGEAFGGASLSAGEVEVPDDENA
jgi:hypothetical protein